MKLLSLCVDTTGVDFAKDHIIRITASMMEYGGGVEKGKVYIVKPDGEYKIDDFITEKTGLTREVVDSQGVPLADIARELLDMIAQSDAIVAYNTEFHINFLQCAFDKLGLDPHFEAHSIIDPYLIEFATNSHSLDNVYHRALGDEPASNNAEKVLKLFTMSQMKNIDKDTIKKFRDPNDVQHYPDGWVGVTDDVLVFRRGQYKDQSVKDVMLKDIGYIKWLCGQNKVSMPTRRAFRDILGVIRDESTLIHGTTSQKNN
jgi:DNA polymerase III alpha subunit (gram-positive type)